MKNLLRIFLHWLPFGMVITMMTFFIYVTIQQSYRQGANDPQIQIAEDTENSLNQGVQPYSLISSKKTDIEQSLSPYLIIYDKDGIPLVSSAYLDGKIPSIPNGIFDYVKKYGEDRITWQPRVGVRSAIIVRSFQGLTSGYIVSGRSLREIENRQETFFLMTICTWVGMLFISLVTVFISDFSILIMKRRG